MKTVDWIATALVVVGALNWGLVGVADFNLVTALLGQTALASIVFALVGVAGVYFVARWAASPRRRLGGVPA